MDLTDMDLQSIAVTCELHDPHSIPEQQLQLLKDCFMHSKEFWYPTSKGKQTLSSSLYVKTHSSNDNPKLSKEEKKRDRQSNKQLLQELG